MVVSDLQKARSRSIAAISVLDRRHFILIARKRHNFRFTSRAQYACADVRIYTLARITYVSPRATVNKFKNEVGCRDDTVPKTRRHCEEE